MNNEHKYDDIINLEHHISKKHKQMSLENRSAQFAPFAALVGYDDAVKETARITDSKIFIDDEIKEIINKTIQQIKNNLNKHVQIKVTYFIPDKLKSGGKYQIEVGIVAKINEYSKIIKLETGTEIPIEEIIELEILKNVYTNICSYCKIYPIVQK